MGITTGPLGRDCFAEEARSASTLVSTRQFATAAGDLHLRMGSPVRFRRGAPHWLLPGKMLVRGAFGVGSACSEVVSCLSGSAGSGRIADENASLHNLLGSQGGQFQNR